MKAIILIGISVVVVVAVFIILNQKDSPEIREWKRNAATAIKSEFLFEIDEAFSITRDNQPILAITGTVMQGKAEVGDKVIINTAHGSIETKLEAIQMFQKELDVANPGDMIGLLVQGVDKSSIVKGKTIIMAE